MWLLDVNVPRKTAAVLGAFGVQAVTAESRGWRGLTNGELVEAAAEAASRSCSPATGFSVSRRPLQFGGFRIFASCSSPSLNFVASSSSKNSAWLGKRTRFGLLRGSSSAGLHPSPNSATRPAGRVKGSPWRISAAVGFQSSAFIGG